MSFIRAAAMSNGGLPAVALLSTASVGKDSRVVSELKPRAGVVTTPDHVNRIVTECGALNLYEMSIRQRGEHFISIAHPSFRAELSKQFSSISHYLLG